MAEPGCVGDWINDAASVEGTVFGANAFSHELAENIHFALIPDEAGWRVAIIGANGAEIPTRPKARGIPPAADDTSRWTEFVFGPDIFDPALNPELTVPGGAPPNQASVQPRLGTQGRGQLTIHKSGFDDAVPPRMVYMDFHACVYWNNGPREPDDAHYGDLGAPQEIASWVVTAYEDCGLPKTYLLSGRMHNPETGQRAWLEPDFDRDGRPDLAAMVAHSASGRAGLALCLQSTKSLTVLGFDATAGDGLESSELAEVDWWAVSEASIVIGIEGASSKKIMLNENARYAVEQHGD